MKGLEEFRKVEKEEINEQEKVRIAAKDLDKMIRSGGQQNLFGSSELDAPSSFAQELGAQKRKATDRLNTLLDERGRVSYEDVLLSLLELPLVWESVIQEIISEEKERGRLKIEGQTKRERTVKKGHYLVRT